MHLISLLCDLKVRAVLATKKSNKGGLDCLTTFNAQRCSILYSMISKKKRNLPESSKTTNFFH